MPEPRPASAAAIVTKSESFTAEEALKKKAVDFVVADIPALLAAIDGREVSVAGGVVKFETKGITPIKMEMTLQQKVLHAIADPNISTLLLTLGGIGLYAEFSAGFSVVVPGALGVLCLLLGFVSLQTIPVNVGGAMLFLLGFALLAAEAYVTSYGLLTVAALASIFFGGLFLVDAGASDLRVSLYLLVPLVASLGACTAIVGLLLLRDQRRPKLSKQDPVVGKRARVHQISADGKHGKAYVNGELWNFDANQALVVGEEALVEALVRMQLQLKKGE